MTSSGARYKLKSIDNIISEWVSLDPDIEAFRGGKWNGREVLCIGSKFHNGIASYPPLSVSFRMERMQLAIPEFEGMPGEQIQLGKETRRMKIPDPSKIKVYFCVQNAVVVGRKMQEILEIKDLKLIEDGFAIIGQYRFESDDIQYLIENTLKTKVNMNLLYFFTEVSINNKRESLHHGSRNAVHIYRKKIIIFIPGLLGSQMFVDVKEDGKLQRKRVFPSVDYKDIGFSFLKWRPPVVGAIAAGIDIHKLLHGKVGLLECDTKGEPLLKANASLLQLLGEVPGTIVNNVAESGVIYDVADVAYNRIQKRLESFIPGLKLDTNAFKFIRTEVYPFPYDWRLNLEETTKELKGYLEKLQSAIHDHTTDTDDKISVAGHSTGGLIIRRLCTFCGIEQIVDKTFYINVPFRGAPKALSVMLFGGEQIKGKFKAMVPIITPNSMVNIAPSLPVVYFLAPSKRYPKSVTPFGYGPNKDIESEKKGLIDFATDCGIYFKRKSVNPKASNSVREEIALSAETWHRIWNEYSRKKESPIWSQDIATQEMISAIGYESKENPYFKLNEIYRKEEVGWISALASEAEQFHDVSEREIGNSKVELYVFYSSGHQTTGYVSIESYGQVEEVPAIEWIKDKRIPNEKFPDNLIFEQWIAGKSVGSRFPFAKKTWRFITKPTDGDGTVPLESLLGIGSGNAVVFRAIPKKGEPNCNVLGPSHVPAPNSPYVWDRIIDIILGENVKIYIDSDVDPVEGKIYENKIYLPL